MAGQDKLSTDIKSLLEDHGKSYKGRPGNSEAFVRDILLRLEPASQVSRMELLKEWFLPVVQLGFALFVFLFQSSPMQSSTATFNSASTEHDVGSLLLSSTQSEWAKEDLSPNVSNLSLALGISALGNSSQEEL